MALEERHPLSCRSWSVLILDRPSPISGFICLAFWLLKKEKDGIVVACRWAGLFLAFWVVILPHSAILGRGTWSQRQGKSRRKAVLRTKNRISLTRHATVNLRRLIGE